MSASPQQRLVVEYRPEEGALVRMLGLVERRGFRVRRAVTGELPCGRRATLAITVEALDPARSIDILALQLGRLHGVGRVHHETMVHQETKAFFQDQAA